MSHHDPVLARYHELEVAYRELLAEHLRMVKQFDKLRADLRACWVELERLRGIDRAQAAERDERAPLN